MSVEMLYLNGEFMPLSEGRVNIEDRGFELGDGVYEVIKVMNGRLVWLDDHLARLGNSLTAVRLTGALDAHPLEHVLPDLVGRSGLVDGSMYLQVTRGVAPRELVFPEPQRPTILAYTRAMTFPSAEFILAGVTLHALEDLRWARCDIKSTSLLAAVLAKQEAREAGAHEAVFVGPDGVVREGGSSNIFALLDGVVRTHPLSNRILSGITRKHVLEMALEAGYRVEERAFTLDEIVAPHGAGFEVFTASTTMDIVPVVRVDEHQIGDGRPGRVTLALLDLMRDEQARLTGRERPPALTGRVER